MQKNGVLTIVNVELSTDETSLQFAAMARDYGDGIKQLKAGADNNLLKTLRTSLVGISCTVSSRLHRPDSLWACTCVCRCKNMSVVVSHVAFSRFFPAPLILLTPVHYRCVYQQGGNAHTFAYGALHANLAIGPAELMVQTLAALGRVKDIAVAKEFKPDAELADEKSWDGIVANGATTLAALACVVGLVLPCLCVLLSSSSKGELNGTRTWGICALAPISDYAMSDLQTLWLHTSSERGSHTCVVFTRIVLRMDVSLSCLKMAPSEQDAVMRASSKTSSLPVRFVFPPVMYQQCAFTRTDIDTR